MGRRLSVALLAVVMAVVGGSFSLTAAQAQSSPGPAQVGRFLPPFEDTRPGEGPEACRTDADGRKLCKPAGATVVALANGKVLYWDALEGTENVQLSIVLEFAKQARNDRSPSSARRTRPTAARTRVAIPGTRSRSRRSRCRAGTATRR